jgi:hypothetical protein
MATTTVINIILSPFLFVYNLYFKKNSSEIKTTETLEINKSIEITKPIIPVETTQIKILETTPIKPIEIIKQSQPHVEIRTM